MRNATGTTVPELPAQPVWQGVAYVVGLIGSVALLAVILSSWASYCKHERSQDGVKRKKNDNTARLPEESNPQAAAACGEQKSNYLRISRII